MNTPENMNEDGAANLTLHVPLGLSALRKKCCMTPAHIAAFIGISTPSYWDLETIDDEIETLSVGQLIRLYILFQVPDALTAYVKANGKTSAGIANRFVDSFGKLSA